VLSVVVHRPDNLVSLRHLPSWALLAFAAGAVNAGALLACERFVSHVTGTLTRLGVDAGQLLAFDYLLVFAAFLVGAGMAIVVVRRGVSKGTGLPPYWLPLTIVAVLLAAVGVAGHAGVFGRFGGSVETAHDFALLAILSFAMGMQNAAVAASTGMAVRTTHMTGPATDLAIAVAILAVGEERERADARRSVVLRGTKLAAFVVGGTAMAVVCPRIGYLGFLIPAFACVAATVSSFAPSRLRAPA